MFFFHVSRIRKLLMLIVVLRLLSTVAFPAEAKAS